MNLTVIDEVGTNYFHFLLRCDCGAEVIRARIDASDYMDAKGDVDQDRLNAEAAKAAAADRGTLQRHFSVCPLRLAN